MSGLEISGLVIAGSSFVFQIFASCIRAFQTISEFRTASNNAKSLQHCLQLEEHRLLLWSRRAALSDGSLDGRLDAQLVQTTLLQIRTLLTDSDALRTKYGITTIEEAGRDNVTRPIILSAVQIHFRRQISHIFKGSPGRRLLWVAKDQVSCEKLLMKLRGLIDVLHEILSDAQQDHIRNDLRFLNLSLINLSDRIDDLHSLQLALQASPQPNTEICCCAAIKSLRMELEQFSLSIETEPPTAPHFSSLLPPLRSYLLTNVKGGSSRALAKYEGSPVFIEWKSMAAEESGMRAVQIGTRVATLATLLGMEKPESFRSLTCMGTFEEARSLRYGFVYRLPSDVNLEHTPKSLLDLFYDSTVLPTLSLRIKLALSLATTLLHLHTSGWMHKEIRSDNIIFFKSEQDTPWNLSDPYLIGYEYARFDSSEHISENLPPNPEYDIYRHPLAHSECMRRYRKDFDLYSLGIVLMEIAKWKPVKRFAKSIINTKRRNMNDLRELREAVLDTSNQKLLPDVDFRAGSIYRGVVFNCINYPEGVTEPDESDEKFHQTLVEKVVKPLARCSI
ncbi:MAG: hypothetical protein LQ342_002462 [Letrouitia transgressa]|nr:MAG: hypothetical protein LQ342_002462 [Letrouitia transgressa]